MDKEFVLYPEALELKQLGFDEPCFGKFLTSFQSNWKDYELILELGMNDTFEDNRNIYLLEKACSAPTFSQAFRWFRGKGYRFNVVNDSSQVDGDYFYDVWLNGKFLFESNYIYKTYEEAELACLRKLIEIVKTKQ